MTSQALGTAGATYDGAIWEDIYTATASYSEFWGTYYTSAHRLPR